MAKNFAEIALTASVKAQHRRCLEFERDPERVVLAYTSDSEWRSSEFFTGREAITNFLRRNWDKELDYRLIKRLWAFNEERIAVGFAYEWQDCNGNWFRSYGHANWEFDVNGLMPRRIASINDLSISELERKYYWHQGQHPDNHPKLSDLGLKGNALFLFARSISAISAAD